MKKYLFFIIAVIFLSSCTQRSLRYIQDKKEFKHEDQTEFSNQPPEYKLQAYDVLYIKVSTTNSAVNAVFSENVTSSYGQTGNLQGGGDSYFTGYMVTDTGYIKVPLLGDFLVKDKTVAEVEKMVVDKVAELLIDAIIKVKLISFKVYFIGDVNTSMTFYQENVNFLQAVATIGGISDYGDKRRIMIVRQTETGFKIFRIDVTKRNIMEKEEFYLLPNDIVYIEPVKVKSFTLALQDFSVIFSLITSLTSTISIILVLINLGK